MPSVLCFADCHNFQREVAAAIALEGWDDVATLAFPPFCGRPPLDWEALRPLLPEGCVQVVFLGRACLAGLEQPPPGWPSVRLLPQAQCFHLVAPASLVDQAIERGAYLLTPSWLENWRARLADLGFAADGAGEFFRDCARELVLLDTGLDPEAPRRLAELAAALDLPAVRLAVGLDHLRLLLARIVAEWRLEQAQRAARERDRDHARELADRAAAMDFLARLAQARQESEAVALIKDLFNMLFAPGELHYLRLENGVAAPSPDIPPGLREQMLGCAADHAWTASGRGFLLRIARGGQALGVVAVDQLAFPEFRERYLNLALALSGVLGLAIENARIHKRLVEAEKMASLGYLVAGVAHEINTPLGVGLAAASSLREQSLGIAERFAARRLSQSELDAYLDASGSATGLLLANLQRIGRIVDAFRQVAVAGDPPERRRFRLKDCLEDALRAMGERLAAGGRIEVSVHCDEGLEIESYPGDWAAIFLNLLSNSLSHGFKGRDRGRIDIAVASEADRLAVDYRDDGAGMAPETLERAFDPFFTTDLGAGMGLGLHLVYNLATQRLGGSIGCESQPGHGARFHLEVPT
jgi:signal transduction histidine kinase